MRENIKMGNYGMKNNEVQGSFNYLRAKLESQRDNIELNLKFLVETKQYLETDCLTKEVLEMVIVLITEKIYKQNERIENNEI
jgi:hypothetical protein